MPTKVKTVGKEPVVRFTGFPTQTRPASPVPKRRTMTVLKLKDHQEPEEHQTDQEDTWSTGSIEARMSKTDNGRWLVDSGSSDDFLSKKDVNFLTAQQPLQNDIVINGLNGSDICKTGGKLVIHIGQGKTLECENAKVMEKGSQSLIAEHGLAENYVKEKIGNKVTIFDMEGKILVKGHHPWFMLSGMHPNNESTSCKNWNCRTKENGHQHLGPKNGPQPL